MAAGAKYVAFLPHKQTVPALLYKLSGFEGIYRCRTRCVYEAQFRTLTFCQANTACYGADSTTFNVGVYDAHSRNLTKSSAPYRRCSEIARPKWITLEKF